MLPSFYDSSKCGTLFKPDLARSANEGTEYAKSNGIKAVKSSNTANIALIVIDGQIDFVSPSVGCLYVQGAEKDIDRGNQFIYNNVATISQIIASLDTHYLFQPFHPYNWIAGSKPTSRANGSFYVEGEHPDPFTIITLASVGNDTWRPVRMPGRQRQMLQKLEQNKKKQLCIWPVHCILGSPGNALDPTLLEAIFFHAACRQSQYTILDKGKSFSSEHYGIWQAEVEFPDDPTTALRNDIINQWSRADRIYFMGQAKSHCVLETLNQSVEIMKATDPKALQKMHIIEDCMSCVPDICDDTGKVLVPFAKWTADRFQEFKDMGINFVKSTDLISV